MNRRTKEETLKVIWIFMRFGATAYTIRLGLEAIYKADSFESFYSEPDIQQFSLLIFVFIGFYLEGGRQIQVAGITAPPLRLSSTVVMNLFQLVVNGWRLWVLRQEKVCAFVCYIFRSPKLLA